MSSRRAAHHKKPKRKARIIALVSVLTVLILLGGGAASVWVLYGERIAVELGWVSNDYDGEGHGEVIITIRSGDIGADVAETLAAAGVVKTAEAFYELLLKQHPPIEFHIGSYRLKSEMSARAALDALLDPENKVELRLTIPEGMAAADALQRAAELTGIPVAEFEAAVADPSAYGVPAEFPSIEGFLFPATYMLEPDDTAETIVQRMVDRMWQALDERGVSAAEAWRVLTLASIVQREAGSDLEDFPKISRVFLNRLEIGMNLQSDATVAYGTGNTHTVWTTSEERANAANLYNTYANPGLPIGPIGLPGDVAIDAALHPADGDWLFFMPINLETGYTVFSHTVEEHEVAVEQLAAWCTEHRAAGGTRCD